MTKAVRVLHVAETVRGGPATYISDLIALQAKEFGAENIFSVTPLQDLSLLNFPAGVGSIGYRPWRWRVMSSLALAIRVCREMRNIRPNVVHMHSTFAGLFLRGLLWVMYPNVVRVYCPHGWAFDRNASYLMKRIYISIELFLSNFDNAIICISSHERRIALQHGFLPSRLFLVKNGISNVDFSQLTDPVGWPKDCLRLLYVGRLDRQKGVDVLTRAMSLLGAGFHCILIGSAVVDTYIDDQPHSNITFGGWMTGDQLLAHFHFADVLVVPSRWEGFGLVAVEAMRAGTAVVASRVGGLVEIVEENVTGLLVEPDSPDALANTLRACTAREFREMGQAGLRRYQGEFTASRVHQEILGIYQKFL
ncbi:MAG: hypothetical protein CFE44_02110 [Burkholderiales bacterium PBB4]|nr:MAG: hypothetical protein CFE44_02110 [Burkholderiales bacterium PBB4]